MIPIILYSADGWVILEIENHYLLSRHYLGSEICPANYEPNNVPLDVVLREAQRRAATVEYITEDLRDRMLNMEGV